MNRVMPRRRWLLLGLLCAAAGLGKGSAPLSPYDALFQRYGARYGLDWRLLASVAYEESRFDPRARSYAGARGLFQVMPATGKQLGFDDLEDPEQGIHAGVLYLHQQLGRFEPSLPPTERLAFALAAYNAGFGHVDDARKLASQLGWDPDRWEGNVERALLLLEQPRHFRRARHGFVRGWEPARYVAQVQQHYHRSLRQHPAP